jgi:ABC-type oligopeptide transport system substrate-binding subunit/class 3 adenylate cyclase/tetratricopeptide (TPR) repeat protein
MNCPTCHTPNDPDAAFCEQCGGPLKRNCLQCGAPLKPGARFCKQCGAPAYGEAAGDPRLAALQTTAPQELQSKMRSASRQSEGERKPVTILFTDIVGSTALAERLDPEEWKEIVSGAHRIVSQAVYRYEGTIAQLLGDGVLAFFGAPVTHEDDPVRAVLAAQEIQGAMADYERRLRGVVDHFQMRIGLNTGMVVVGSVGTDLHLEYLAIGDAVNLAARLQSACRPGGVLLSQSTARLVEAAFSLQPLGEIEIKGKSEPVAVFEAGEARAPRDSRRGFAELRSPLVGRDTELADLRGALMQLGAGLGQIVSVTGEAGIGKSRLVEEACRLGGERCQALRWLEGRALSYGQKLSFWTIQQLLHADLGLADGDPELKVRLALRRRLEGLFGAEAPQLYPSLASLLGVQLEGEADEALSRLDGEALKYQALLAIARYFTRLAEQQPTVLVFDDLHWADPSTLEALERLLPITDHAPLLLLIVSRLEREHASWRLILKAQSEYAHRYTGLTLTPLSGEQQNTMVDHLLAIADLPETVRLRILERAEGNPLFLEEIVRHLVDQGVILREGERYRATSALLEVTIPETLRGVLLARIDRLQDDVRRTLQLASVIGKSFLFSLLAAIAEAEVQLEGQLSQLQRADLVREKTRLPELEYMFKHSLTQEAAYASLLLEERREFHRKVGLALEGLFAGREEDFAGLLVYHFDAAGEIEPTLHYLEQAGDRARVSDEHMEAVGYYRRAVELLEPLGESQRLAAVWLKLGLVYHANYQFEEAYRAYEKAFALKVRHSARPEVPPVVPHATLKVHSGYHHRDRFDPGVVSHSSECTVVHHLFSGLVFIDPNLNVLPDVARSWQVLNGGRRYRFYLRQDVRWTDGPSVTAYDFAWAWKRNLHPAQDNFSTILLYDVLGAREYHEGRNPDPDSVGVRALDAWTLEVDLERPAPYFPYIVSLPITFPIPERVVRQYGETWGQPGQIISNGPFSLVSYDPDEGVVVAECNPHYHSEVIGNVRRIEWRDALPEVSQELYQAEGDILILPRYQYVGQPPPGEMVQSRDMSTYYLLINPSRTPFDNPLVRRALALAMDWEGLAGVGNMTASLGGIIPPGMAGHSPDVRLPYNRQAARDLLVQAGYPAGQGLPVIRGVTFPSQVKFFRAITDRWQADLGVQVEIDGVSSPDEMLTEHYGLSMVGWVADFPDPENFMRHSGFNYYLHRLGWQDAEYDDLVEAAGSTQDRRRRMALYRLADRRLVSELNLVLPVAYPENASLTLVKPWIKNFTTNRLGWEYFLWVQVGEH